MDVIELIEFRRLDPNCPVMIADVPKPIMKEIDEWVKVCREIKNHPLSQLKAHENAAYNYRSVNAAREWRNSSSYSIGNTYQCSVPSHLVQNSFWLAWTLRACAKYWGNGNTHRRFRLREWKGHFDMHDMWINFAYKGDCNLVHRHGGDYSGVLYYKNHKHPTLFDDYGIGYEGWNGTMALWPSDTNHHVEVQKANKERITFAFNISQDVKKES